MVNRIGAGFGAEPRKVIGPCTRDRRSEDYPTHNYCIVCNTEGTLDTEERTQIIDIHSRHLLRLSLNLSEMSVGVLCIHRVLGFDNLTFEIRFHQVNILAMIFLGCES